jgi:nitroimidazol reductase NimA-like FMN-containing flavoprotein (pyridoxamine 5'-phosphate oxidase superfamily)
VNPQKITAYLDASYSAVVATVNRNGTPHLTPNGYRYDRTVLTLITRADRLMYRNLPRHHRISVSVYDSLSARLMWSSPGSRPAMTRIFGTRPAASSNAIGHRH